MEQPDQVTQTIQKLTNQVQDEPNNWGVRKKLALMLYEDTKYLEAADVLWKAPEMPATDVDVAFSVKIVSRARPNRSIRLIYEMLRRNEGKPLKNVAMARALNMIGMPMLASRFYGAAVAQDPEYFDLSFEKQAMWYDDSESLLVKWKESDQEAKPPLSVPLQDFAGEVITMDTLSKHVGEETELSGGAGIGGPPILAPSAPQAPAARQAPALPKLNLSAPGAPTTPLVMPKPLGGPVAPTGAPAPTGSRPDVDSGQANGGESSGAVAPRPTLLRPSIDKPRDE